MNRFYSTTFTQRVVQFSRIIGARHILVDGNAGYSTVASTSSSRKSGGQYFNIRCQQCLPLHKKLAPEWIHCCSLTTNETIDPLTFETLVEESLQTLLDFFEQLGDEEDVHTDFDVTYASGVLTVHFGPDHGTYVINKQTPNQQMWLSSPTSGPKRYDYVDDNWVYSHDGVPMHRLLSEEISKILNVDLDFFKVMKPKDT